MPEWPRRSELERPRPPTSGRKWQVTGHLAHLTSQYHLPQAHRWHSWSSGINWTMEHSSPCSRGGDLPPHPDAGKLGLENPV